jgi:hypothetical protein
MEIKNPLLQYLEGEGTRLEERVKTRVKYKNIIKRSKTKDPANVRITSSNTSILVEVISDDSIRIRDAGFGRYYKKGVRHYPAKPDQRVKKRRKFKLLNRPMYDMYNRFMRVGINVLGRTVSTNILDLINKNNGTTS